MIEIIPASQQNLKQVASLFDQYRVFYNMSSDIAAAENFIQKRIAQQDSLIFLAFKQSAAVGFMQIYPSFSSMAMLPIWILNDLFVCSSARQTGCAKKMMMYLQERAKNHGIFSIKLATENTNYKAKALYHGLGYQLNQNFSHYSKLTK